MMLSLFIFLLVFGVAVPQDCGKLARRYCDANYDESLSQNGFCIQYDDFQQCFKDVNTYCYGYFEFVQRKVCKNFPKATTPSHSRSPKPYAEKFQTILFTASLTFLKYI
ncbi:uncharacterized protein LOC128249838 [Octopus bimaculoides]|uniref:uncharacterized protein LOC128249838 n=1 Tax=Octopus bimaculoides TaxID=37653 RepID=UPI0022E161FF|nr:uncharacterized protein LOC128249838 [Octopus bimaculoides]